MGYFGMNWVSTVIIPKKYDKIMMKERNNDEYTNISITLEQIYGNEIALNLFINYMIKEYSLELVLSTIEFVQFQMYLKQYVADADTESTAADITNGEIQSANIRLSKNIPTSKIIQDAKMMQASVLDISKQIAHGLYNKYVVSGSEFEINISGLWREEKRDII